MALQLHELIDVFDGDYFLLCANSSDYDTKHVARLNCRLAISAILHALNQAGHQGQVARYC